jgi:hypothetical protein
MTVPSPLTKDDVEACGIGLGSKCCAYIFVDGTGFNCGKVEDSLGAALTAMGNTRGLRVPTGDYPNCQISECDECGGDIHVEEGRWFHTRIDDGSHEARP